MIKSSQDCVAEFPYKHLYLTDEDVERLVLNLRNYKPEILSSVTLKLPNIKEISLYPKQLMFDNKTAIILSDDTYHAKYTDLAYYFTEKSLVKTRRKFNGKYGMTPLEFYAANKNKVMNFCKTKFGDTSIFSLRETLFEMNYEPTEHKPHAALAVYNIFKPEHILDFSAGRGVRLLSALIYGAKSYTGVDPDIGAKECHLSILNNKFLVSKLIPLKLANVCKTPVLRYKCDTEFYSEGTEVTLYQSPFEKLSVNDFDTLFDLIYTSPPYFDLEEYSKEKTQSSIAYSTLGAWLANFLYPSLKLSINLLKKGGVLALNISDSRDSEPFCGKTLKFLFTNRSLKYRGVIAYAHKSGQYYKSPQPIWIFEKL